MGRSSRAVAQQHREEAICAAARLFREYGVESVSLHRIAQEVGLTHGFFARHFASKEELVAAAVEGAFDEVLQKTDGGCVTSGIIHRRSTGCPVIAFAASAFHAPADSAVRRAYTAGLRKLLERISAEDAGDGQRTRVLTALAACVGSAVIAQAAASDPLADDILDATDLAETGRRPPTTSESGQRGALHKRRLRDPSVATIPGPRMT